MIKFPRSVPPIVYTLLRLVAILCHDVRPERCRILQMHMPSARCSGDGDDMSDIYWPSTEPSIKRCTCVSERKNGRSRWTLENNIKRCPGGSNSVDTGMPKWEPACRLRTLGPQWPTVEQPQPRCERSAAMVVRRTWVNIAVCPLISHTQQNITLSKIKCERFIFL